MCWVFFRSAVGGSNDLKADWSPINRFNPDTFLCLSQTRTGGVMVSILTSNVVDSKFELQSGRQIKDSK
jgi:hypothetical protein